MWKLPELMTALETGTTSSEALVQEALTRAQDAEGEGSRAFLTLNEQAVTLAREIDAARAAGRQPSPLAGIPISVKDLFDVAGEVTRAGSRVLADAKPAAATAPAIARLLEAGLVPVGRTNMTEFAYSGVGLNPHYDTPRSVWDRQTGRVPGGSSSGAAVSVADGMAAAGIGTDTGGSCRIPAALNAITGWKPTARRVPREGVYPLSESLDSVGVLAGDVSSCVLLDACMAGEAVAVPEPASASGVRLAVLDHYVIEDMDDAVAEGWAASLRKLEAAGARLVPLNLPGIEQLPTLNANGGIAAAEAYAFHQALLAERGDDYDPRVAGRIRAGAGVDAEELAAIRVARSTLIAEFEGAMAGFDGLLCPTVPIVPPAMAEFALDADYVRLNLLLLRNPSLFNFLDGCAISLPVSRPGEAPVGLMLARPAGQDRALLSVAQGIEATISR